MSTLRTAGEVTEVVKWPAATESSAMYTFLAAGRCARVWTS